MRKFTVILGFCIGALSIMSFSTTDTQALDALEAGGPKITCPQGDNYKCVEKAGVIYYKGSGNTTIEL